MNAIFSNSNELSLEIKLINILILFPLLSSSIHLKDICLRVFLVVGFSSAAFHLQIGIMHVNFSVRKTVNVVLLSVLLCMLHWLVGFPTLLD